MEACLSRSLDTMLGEGMLGEGMLGEGMLGEGMLGEGMLGGGMLATIAWYGGMIRRHGMKA